MNTRGARIPVGVGLVELPDLRPGEPLERPRPRPLRQYFGASERGRDLVTLVTRAAVHPDGRHAARQRAVFLQVDAAMLLRGSADRTQSAEIETASRNVAHHRFE